LLVIKTVSQKDISVSTAKELLPANEYSIMIGHRAGLTYTFLWNRFERVLHEEAFNHIKQATDASGKGIIGRASLTNIYTIFRDECDERRLETVLMN
jgi:hypothetical protein